MTSFKRSRAAASGSTNTMSNLNICNPANTGPCASEVVANGSSPVRNKVTPEGQLVGKQMARWCDDAEPIARLKAPDLPPRCASCAFRNGKHLANGSPATQLDAMKCVIEGVPFYCHDVHRSDQLCSGWVMMELARKDEPSKTPWDFIGGLEK